MNAILKPFAMANPEIRQIPYWEVEAYWPKYSAMVQKALDTQDEWTLEAVLKELTNASYSQRPMQLWVIPEKFALITQIQVSPFTGIRRCLLFLGGGEDMEAIRNTRPVLANWAKKFHNCTKFRIVGRRGWLKGLDGFTEKETVMESDI